jgi:hypothetical protein
MSSGFWQVRRAQGQDAGPRASIKPLAASDCDHRQLGRSRPPLEFLQYGKTIHTTIDLTMASPRPVPPTSRVSELSTR